jgi:hypothetical protein
VHNRQTVPGRRHDPFLAGEHFQVDGFDHCPHWQQFSEIVAMLDAGQLQPIVGAVVEYYHVEDILDSRSARLRRAFGDRSVRSMEF